MNMRNQDCRRGAFPMTLSILTLLAVSVLLIFLYRLTKYVPLMLSALIVLLPTLINLILLIFCKDIPIAKSADGAGNAEDFPGSADNGEAVVPIENVKITKKQKLKKIFAAIGRFFCFIGRLIAIAFNKSRNALRLILSVASSAGLVLYFFVMFRRMTSVYTLAYWQPILFAAVFVIFIVLDKWCKHTETDNKFIAAMIFNTRTVLAVGRMALLLDAVAAMLKLLGIYDIQKYLVYALAAVFCYTTVFLLISFAARYIKKELSTVPLISIPIPFVTGGANDLGVLSYLEESTGITMRGLWSIKLVKHILPYTVISIVVLLWLSTGIVQVESYQQAAVYRLGHLLPETLEPGIHFVFPAPIDKVVCRNTDTVNKMTIGYRSSEDSDNTWTASHGDSEYRLLLGGGNELVSVNLRIEYKINDLYKYLSNCSAPESLLEASAYELVTDRMISTDLTTLLSVDRAAFADNFHDELDRKIGEYNIGIDVVSVVLESIHPPIDIAEIYQRTISAGIDAEKYILNAKALAAVTIAKAEKSYDTAVKQANAENYTKVANARSEVAEFMAGVEAHKSYPDAYTYYKYLNAIRRAYGNAKIVIVGEGINSENLYFGSFTSNTPQ